MGKGGVKEWESCVIVQQCVLFQTTAFRIAERVNKCLESNPGKNISLTRKTVE